MSPAYAWLRVDRQRGAGWTLAHLFEVVAGAREGAATCGYDPMPKAGQPDVRIVATLAGTVPRCSRCQANASSHP